MPISINDSLKVPLFHDTFITKNTIENYVEKLSLFDLMKYGENINESENDNFYFSRTLIVEFCKKYNREDKVEEMMNLYEKLLVNYFNKFVEYCNEALNQKKDLFIKKII